MAVQQVRDLSGLSRWLEENTSDPRDANKKWSFKDHEFQIAIANEDRPLATVKKCSQVGLSELSVRVALGLLVILPSSTAIYTLPSTNFARKFSKARIDPVIKNSRFLSPLVPRDASSSELKEVNGSFLYVTGSFGQTAAISVPADILVRDEVDFSNQKALSTFASRLGHAKDGGITRDFSTPTVGGYGISRAFEDSSQARYAVKHDKCGEWVTPHFMEDVVVPGFDGDMYMFELTDLTTHDVGVGDAFLKCPHCGNEIKHENLCDPDKRQWIEKYPTRTHHAGYQVMPFDVPTVNPIAKTIRQMKEYERKADWVNFKIGETYEDAQTSFLIDKIRNNQIPWVRPTNYAANNCIMGLDVGKTSWVLIGRRGTGGVIDVIHAESIKQNENDQLHFRLMELVRMYGVVKLVSDAAPDFSTALKLIGELPIGHAYGAYYVRKTKTAYSNIDVNDVDSIVNLYRTGTLDSTVKATNSGAVRLPKGLPEEKIILEHLSNIKRVTSTASDGENVHTWVKTGSDHYAHALNYLLVADKLCDHFGSMGVIPTLPSIAKAKMRAPDEDSRIRLTVK